MACPLSMSFMSTLLNHQYSDMVFETRRPVPVKRKLSSRFPVIPSTGDASATSSRSPSLSRPSPLIPAKSHYRMASGQQGTGSYHMGALQRPGITPHAVNERNRSNSEGIIQASVAARNKRMGVITRKNTDLSTLDETLPYRNSHLRGLSHGSVLRTRHAGPAPAKHGSNSSSPSSPRERRHLREGWVNRMSSLPEHKGERGSDEPIIESAKGILFAIVQVHAHISTLMTVVKRDDSRRHSLEFVFENASYHVDQLNDVLQNAETSMPEDTRTVTEAVKRECETCVSAYIHVVTQLRHNAAKVVTNGDSRYVRSLMLAMYGGLVELRNACASLNVPLRTVKKRHPPPKSLMSMPSKRTPSKPPAPSPSTDRHQRSLVTPTREPNVPTRRLRSDTTIRHPQIPMAGPVPVTSQSAVASPVTPSFNFTRSRSSSRSNTVNSSVPTSLITPRSGEAFPSISTSGARINPLTGLDEIEEDRIFEKIFHQLTAAYKAALQALPLARRQFSRCLEAAEQQRDTERIQLLWNNLIRRCRHCLEVSDTLGLRLESMKVREPGGGLRNQREFWQLCKGFMQSFVDLVNEMREVRSMQLLPQDIIIILRPVQKASREAGRLIEASPWSYLADISHAPSNLYGPPLQPPHSQHQTSASTSALTAHPNPYGLAVGVPPQSVTVPTTPLSAALGPAAQATVPSTPASAYSDKFFEGDVFQRADSLLSMGNQAPYFRR